MQREKPRLTGRAANQQLRRRNNRIIIITSLAMVLSVAVGLVSGGWTSKKMTIRHGDDIFLVMAQLKEAGVKDMRLTEQELYIPPQPPSPISAILPMQQPKSYQLRYRNNQITAITVRSGKQNESATKITLGLPS